MSDTHLLLFIIHVFVDIIRWGKQEGRMSLFAWEN